MARNSKNQQKRRDREDTRTRADLPAKPNRRTKSAELKAQENWMRTTKNPLVCRTDAQSRYLEAIQNHTITFGVGPAGTGKTHVCVKYGAQEIDQGHYNEIIITRPIVETGPSLGALPGDVGDKVDPWMDPFVKVLLKHYGQAAMDAKFNGAHPSITFVPLQHMRGRTFENSYVILDEAQNATPEQMKTFLTRIGANCKVVINGDVDQIDIKTLSGMVEALEILQGMDDLAVAEFTEDDVVRDPIVKAILKRYKAHSLFTRGKGKSK